MAIGAGHVSTGALVLCHRCHAHDSDDAQFCWRCGAPLRTIVRPAGLWVRAAAWFIDATLCLIPVFVGLTLIGIADSRNQQVLKPSEGLSAPIWVWLPLLLAWGIAVMAYFSLLNRQTLGAMAVGIELRDARTGGSVTRRRALARFVTRLVLYSMFLVPGLVADLFTLWTNRKQNLIDLLFRTEVVRV